MPKNPKQEKEGSVEEDQKDHEYYYDDAHGYEEYDPEEEDDDRDAAAHGRGDAEIHDADDSTKGAM
ncbi:MAG: hypothetical protein DMF63_07755 [Acidobacteria bacterium]|nr:MAG: hypothetical protein DMF63_07755 [Acidobacteriota bacterium]